MSLDEQVQRGHVLRHRRRSRLDPHRRGPNAAHHQRPHGRCRQALYPVRRDRAEPARDVDYEVDEEKKQVSPTEDGIDKVEAALGIENIYDDPSANYRAPPQRRAPGQRAVQARRGLPRRRWRSEDRRRVHRSHPRRPSLVRGPAPGGRGEGAGEDQGREPDARHHHAPELLPPLREVGRHDRYGRDRGERVLQPPTGCRSYRSRRTARWSASTRPT